MSGIWDLVQRQYRLIERKQSQILAGNGATEKNNADLSKHIQQLAGLLEIGMELQKLGGSHGPNGEGTPPPPANY